MGLITPEVGMGATAIGGAWLTFFILRFMSKTEKDMDAFKTETKKDLIALRKEMKDGDKTVNAVLATNLSEIKSEIRALQATVNDTLVKSGKIASISERIEEVYHLIKDQNSEMKDDMKDLDKAISKVKENCIKHRANDIC